MKTNRNMYMSSTKLLLIWFVLVLPTCYADDENGLKKFQKGSDDFTGKFLYEAAQNNPEVSIIFSAFSVLFLLAQLTLYTGTGLSLQQLLALLNLDDKSMIRSVIPEYFKALNSQQNVTMHLAQNVYDDINDAFTDSFINDSVNTFNATPQSLDFCQPRQAANTINNWVACETDNMITDLVSPDMLNCDTVLVLVNAIFFKGDWLYAFDPQNTEKQDFYVNNEKTTNVNMMKQTSNFLYAETNNPNAQIIKLPYKSENFSYVAWLPKGDIDDMINTLRNCLSCSLNDAMNTLYNTKVELSLPAYDSTTTTALIGLLQKANVTEIFNPDTAELNDIVKDNKDLFVSFATQKATIIVNEEGSKAAAATAIGVRGQAAPVEPEQPVQFIADHPFVYFILYQGTPIFCGAYFGD